MNHIKITRESLDVNAINDLVAHSSCGAISLFIGTTRDNFNDKKVLSLEYEAYEPMAIKEMTAICEELRSRQKDLFNIAMYHRLGVVPIREISVVIAVSSPHRQAALDAVSYAIEELKRRVPIWKKEKYTDDESAWKENKESSVVKHTNRPQLDFAICPIQEYNPVSTKLVQIGVNDSEICRRIQCFVQKKREEIDINNIMDYTANQLITNPELGENEAEINSCARTNSIFEKQEDSKYHYKVKRIKNSIGPQTRPDYFQTFDKLMTNEITSIKSENANENCNLIKNAESRSALEQRLADIENHLFMPPEYKNESIYNRLKAIENRILYLESISPEYKHFLMDGTLLTQDEEEDILIKPAAVKTPKQPKKYTAEELDIIIAQLEQESNYEIQ